MHTSPNVGHSHIVCVAKMRAPRFPPPLWGRDRERGGDDAPSARLVPDTRTTAGCTWPDLSDRSYEPEAALLYPSPCPSPTRGEGTLWHRSAHLQQCTRVPLRYVCMP